MRIKAHKYQKIIWFIVASLFVSCLCCGCGGGKEVMSDSVTAGEPAGQDSDGSVTPDDTEHVDSDGAKSGEPGDGAGSAPGDAGNAASNDGEDALQTVSGNDAPGNEEASAQTVSGNDMPGTGSAVRRAPVKVKGIYVSGPVAGIDRIDTLIELIDQTELNAMVIDIKNDEGRITYQMQSEQVLEIGAGVNYIKDIDALVSKCKEKDIYLIARIVTFRDPYLAEQKPEWAVHTKEGAVFRDKSGLAWVNPYKREMWDYMVEVASQAAGAGFDEIQFDYIRFSTDIKEDEADYGEESEQVSKIEIITEFTKYMYEKLAPQGVYVAADVFGTVIDNETDQEIVGQDYVQMAQYLDYICPMVYPSHYYSGSYGISIPDAEPYNIIYAAASSSARELQAVSDGHCAGVRPWLQGFTAGWVPGHISYGKEQIRAQIKGAYNAGYDEWILWNAAVKYPPENFLTEEEAVIERQQWEIEKQQEAAGGTQQEAQAAESSEQIVEESGMPVQEAEPAESVSGNG